MDPASSHIGHSASTLPKALITASYIGGGILAEGRCSTSAGPLRRWVPGNRKFRPTSARSAKPVISSGPRWHSSSAQSAAVRLLHDLTPMPGIPPANNARNVAQIDVDPALARRLSSASHKHNRVGTFSSHKRPDGFRPCNSRVDLPLQALWP